MNDQDTALAIATAPGQVRKYSEDQIGVLKRTVAQGTSDDEFSLFMAVAERTGLDPFARQIYAVMRWSQKEGREVMTIQTGIDGYRALAERTGRYGGQLGPMWCDDEGKWTEVWLSRKFPSAAKVAVLHRDFSEPLWAVARWDSYAQKGKNGEPVYQWKIMPDVMIAKCAEALALRRAFPQELSGLYTAEEGTEVGDVQEVTARRPRLVEDDKPPAAEAEAVEGEVVPPTPKPAPKPRATRKPAASKVDASNEQQAPLSGDGDSNKARHDLKTTLDAKFPDEQERVQWMEENAPKGVRGTNVAIGDMSDDEVDAALAVLGNAD